jgi:DNA/RNA endonuclease YhcR with UshA esterase domain
MKKILFAVIFLFIVSFTLNAQDTISSKDAKDYIGKTVFVKGLVSGIFVSQKGNTFINFDEKSPNQTFTVAVFAETKIDVSNIKEGSKVTVYGEIKDYKGKPEIVIEKPEQIISIE